MRGPLSIELPLPPRELTPGLCPDEGRKAEVAVEYRTAVCARLVLALRTSLPLWTGTKVQATFHFADALSRPADQLTASLEPAFEAMVDAGVIDASHVMIRLPPHQWPSQKKRACVMLSITPLAGEEENGDG